MPKKYKIGTRGSLLALTQCTQVKNLLEEITGDQFDLEIIKTEGDENTELPLWQLDGKDFFTKELDHALLTGKVDLVVHSYKDLGSERPEGIQLAAVTKRNYPEDIILYKKSLFSTDELPEVLEIGTSSPRRMTNITTSLGDFLPGDKKVITKNLRGNVNTRIQKLLDGDYHMICLALAGIERLANSEESLNILKDLVKDLSFLVLPPSHFPPAASQGALGIESLADRQDDGELLEKLKKVHCSETFEEVKREREAFVSYGGGCHLAVGIHVKKWQDCFIHTHKGTKDNQDIFIQKIEGLEANENGSAFLEDLINKNIFIGLPYSGPDSRKLDNVYYDKLIKKISLESMPVDIQNPSVAYITSAHCLSNLKYLQNSNVPFIGVCAAGASTMKKLWKENIPVQFCADSHGDQEIKRFLNSKAIQTFLKQENPPRLSVFTHDQAESSIGDVVSSYSREVKEDDVQNFRNEIETIDVFYWTSYFQYQKYLELYPFIETKTHLCGLGKTFKEFSKREIEVTPIELGLFIEFLKKKN